MKNCHHRCRPCCPQQEWNQGGGCAETIVEPTVHCRVPSRHHHQRVRHIVPIVYHQSHHHHRHHEYEVKRKFTHQHNHHEHGRFDGDWCEVDRKRGGLLGQDQGHGEQECGQRPEPRFEGFDAQETGCEFNEQMFS